MSPIARFAQLATLAAALGGCASTARLSAVATPSAHVEAKEASTVAESVATAEGRARSAHAVLTFGGRTFVLLGKSEPPARAADRVVESGGWALLLGTPAPASQTLFTLVGPEGRCRGDAKAELTLALDFGGYAGASLPGPGHRAVEVHGCESLAHQNSLLIALDGDDRAAAWEELAHVDDAPAPADRRLGESEVWLHRWLVDDDGQEVVERSVLEYVTPSCSEERKSVILVDETDHPIASHPGFSFRGAIRTSTSPLLVLMGHDSPEALRVIELGPAETRTVLDDEITVFQDVERPRC